MNTQQQCTEEYSQWWHVELQKYKLQTIAMVYKYYKKLNWKDNRLALIILLISLEKNQLQTYIYFSVEYYVNSDYGINFGFCWYFENSIYNISNTEKYIYLPQYNTEYLKFVKSCIYVTNEHRMQEKLISSPALQIITNTVPVYIKIMENLIKLKVDLCSY